MASTFSFSVIKLETYLWQRGERAKGEVEYPKAIMRPQNIPHFFLMGKVSGSGKKSLMGPSNRGAKMAIFSPLNQQRASVILEGALTSGGGGVTLFNMDQVLDIFSQLGIDGTVFYQFALFIVLFVVLKKAFFNRLLCVIEEREAKTKGLLETAELNLQKADALAGEYNQKIGVFRREAQEVLDKNKQKIDQEREVLVKKEQGIALEAFALEKKKYFQEMKAQKKEIVKKAEGLSEKLVQRLTSM